MVRKMGLVRILRDRVLVSRIVVSATLVYRRNAAALLVRLSKVLIFQQTFSTYDGRTRKPRTSWTKLWCFVGSLHEIVHTINRVLHAVIK